MFIDRREQLEITLDDISNTFGCIEKIYFFNKTLLYHLDKALFNVVEVSIYVTTCNFSCLQFFLYCLKVFAHNKKTARILKFLYLLFAYGLVSFRWLIVLRKVLTVLSLTSHTALTTRSNIFSLYVFLN